MSISYNNTKIWLNDNKFELLSDVEEYIRTKAFNLKCIEGHISNLTITAYRCRKSRAKRDNKQLWLCDICKPKKDLVVKVDYVNLGEQKFKNYCVWLERMKYKVRSTFRDFVENKIAFECLEGHTTTITVKYFGVRKFSKKVIDDPRLLCGHCNVKGEILADKLEQLQISVAKKTSHKILTLKRGRKVTYECSICNEISETNKTNLMKGPTYCLNCSHYNYNQTCFNRKPFVFPSGRIDNVLGHEPLCLMELLKHYNEKDIITDTKVIPRFYYIKVSKITGKEYKGKYYPDIMLPDKIIEVKSEYTFNLDKENNIRKMKTVVLAGYNFEFWIYDTQKRLRVIRKDKC